MKFKSRLAKKIGTEIKKGGDNINVSEKITNMALELENKLKNGKSANYNEENNKQENDNKINNLEIIEQKPLYYNKKKGEKAQFSY